MSAVPFLQKELRELKAHPLGGFRIEVDEDLFTWTVWFSGPSGTLYHPGQYKALMKFPQEFPYKPPEFRVLSTMWHPNVYPDGRVCISILHAPGEDEMNSLETASMRWTPVQSIDKVLLSIVSLLADPDASDAGAPANVDALAEFRKNKELFNKKCADNAAKSLKELPADFEFPPTEDAKTEMPRQMSQYSEPTVVFEDDDDELDEEEEEDDEEKAPFADELQQVRSMGLGADLSDEKLQEMLVKCKGDVSRVLEKLC
jgi:ubiquitin-conjugating enzyme E2 R